MQKWEYKIEDGVFARIVLDDLNKWGDDGWELAGIVQTLEFGPGTIRFFLKRPKP